MLIWENNSSRDALTFGTRVTTDIQEPNKPKKIKNGDNRQWEVSINKHFQRTDESKNIQFTFSNNY